MTDTTPKEGTAPVKCRGCGQWRRAIRTPGLDVPLSECDCGTFRWSHVGAWGDGGWIFSHGPEEFGA